jgi:hypothetical protein
MQADTERKLGELVELLLHGALTGGGAKQTEAARLTEELRARDPKAVELVELMSEGHDMGALVDKRVRALMADEPGLSYSDATRKFLAANPLFEQAWYQQRPGNGSQY